MKAPLLTVESVSKRFGATQALKDASFTIRAGTIHSLVGRNGAGKSTIVNIIAGIYKQDKGKILFEGKDLTPYSVFERQKMGIHIVPQQASIVPELTVAENMFLGVWPKKKNGFVDWKLLFSEAAVELKKYGLDAAPKDKFKTLNAVDKRKVNIIRAMYGGAKLIILDEPTTALTSVERDELFTFVNELKANGTAFIFISHYLQEVVDLSDEVTVLRDGLSFPGSDGEELKEEKLSRLIAGEDVEIFRRTQHAHNNKKQVKLECKNLCGSILKNVSIKLYEREIVGIVGFPGSGARELCRTLFGLEKMTAGSIIIPGKGNLSIPNPTVAMKNGISYLSNDRYKEGIIQLMSIVENISLPLLTSILKTKLGLVDKKKANKNAQNYFDYLKVKANSVFDKAGSLSGGNQQKICVAKTLGPSPDILILDEPTIGIDIKSREEIIEIIDQLTVEKNISVLYLTNDFDELVRITDRIVFFHNGKLMRDVYNNNLSHEDVIKIRDEVKDEASMAGMEACFGG
jgi:simple sugar transport system ATP-binding protein